MGKHLSKYQTEEDYNNNKDNHLKPHISFILKPIKQMIYIPRPKSYAKQYFTIVALEDGLMVKLNTNACEYRIDNGSWSTLSVNSNTPAINKGQILSFKGNLASNSFSSICTFTVNKVFNVEGNIMSLLFGDEFKDKTDLTGYGYAFNGLFNNCTTLQNAENLILPATILANSCYRAMFQNCTSLTTSPKLPATILKTACYAEMFWNCTSLTGAPELQSTTLVDFCYYYMFYGCSKLNYIKMLATNIKAGACLEEWVYAVANTGTFVKHKDMNSLLSGTSGIPNGWTIINDSETNVETNLITFYIDNIEYQAKEGMTWEDWVNSDYNTIQYIICGDGYVRDPNKKSHTLYIPGQSNAMMGSGPRKNDIIENGQTYENYYIGEPCMDGLARPN